MEAWFWLIVAAYVAIIAGLIYRHLRAKAALGKVVLNVKTMPKKFILVLGSFALLFPLAELVSLVRRMAAGDTPGWFLEQYNEQVFFSATFLIVIAIIILSALLNEQIRERGIFHGGIYTWVQVTGYAIGGSGVWINTTQAPWYSRKPRQIKWYLEEKHIPRVVQVLKEMGLKEEENSPS